MNRFYLTPYGTGYVSRPNARASKVIIYLGAGDSHSCVQAAPYKDWCIAVVDAGQATHDAIAADAQCTLIPLWDGGDNYLPLSAEVREIVEPHRSNILTYFENRRVPTGWIVGTMTIGTVIKYVIKTLLVAQLLEDNYPELALDAEARDIPAAQRQRIVQWMNAHGIETGDIDLNWRVRQVLRRIVAQYPYQPIVEFGSAAL